MQDMFSNHRDRKVNSGFTLVELMIAMTIALIVSGALSQVFLNHRHNSTVQEQVAQLQQNVRVGMYVMEHDLRMAGYDPRNTVGASFTAATATSITFSMLADNDNIDNNNDGTIDEANEIETITYQLFDDAADGDTELGKQTADGTGLRVVAQNIDAIEFQYIMDDGTVTTAPGTLDDIREVQVSILARTQRPDPKFNNTIVYTPASGNAAWDINDAAAGTGNPPNDNFRRRLLISTIQCRNMGI